MHQEMPHPTPEHKKLVAAMTGSWTSDETLHPSPWDPKGGVAKGRSEARAVCDGFFVALDYEQEQGGHVRYRGHGVYGYDAASKRFSMQWSDSMGVPSPIVWGSWTGDALTFEMEQPGRGHSRYAYRFGKDGSYAFSIAMSQDGKSWSTMMDARFTRK